MVKFGPWAPDQQYIAGVLVDAINVIPMADKYRAMPTESTISVSAVTGTVNSGFASRLVAGTTKTYVGTSTSIWERNGATFTDVSNSGGYSATVSAWDFTQYRNDVYACDIGYVLQKQTAGSGDFADVSGGPKAAKIANVRQFVVVGDVDESGTLYPNKVRWCAIDDPSDWAISEATQAGAQELDARDGRVMAIKGGEFGLVFQQHAITRMQYIGAPIVWQFDKIDDRNGCEVPGSCVKVGRECYFLSQDGWRVTDGSGQSVNIGDGVLNKWFRADLHTSNKSKIRGAYNPDWRCVVWVYPSAGGNGSNDSMLLYSLEAKRWARADMAADVVFEGATSSVTLEGLDAYFATIEDVTPSLDDPFWIGGEYKWMAVHNGLLVSYDNTPGTATLETADYELNEGAQTRIQAVEPVIDGACTVQIGHKNLLTDAVTYTAAAATNSRTGQANFQHISRWQRLKFAITGSFSNAVGFNLKAKPAGRG